MSALDLLASFLLTLALHATVLLGAVWLAERAGWLRHLGWAEFAWRTALFGALLSAALEFAAPSRWPLPSLPLAMRSTAPPALGEVVRFLPASARPTAQAGETAGLPASTPTLERDPAEAAPALAALGNGESQSFFAPQGGGDVAPPPSDADRAVVALPDIAAVAALGLWLLAFLGGTLQLALQARSLRRLGRSVRAAGTPAGASLARQSARLAAELEIVPPTLLVSAHAASPMVLPGASVLLPAWAETLAPRQQRALLAHELSHLQRRDPAWRIAQRLALLPLSFHPLAWLARQRLEALAEDACDARAAQLMGSGLPLAECLAACLSHAGDRAGQPALAVAMAGDAGPVLRRVKQLLEDSNMSLRPLSPALRRTALALALVALVALPGLAVTTFASKVLAGNLSSLSLGGDSYRYTHNENGEKLQLSLRGDVRFNDAETDVVHLGKGARLAVLEKRDGIEREIEFFGKDGVIQRRYRVDGDARPLDAEGRAWLAALLPGLMRETAINAEARGKALLAKGGPDLLLADIAKIRSDHAAAKYLGVLFANARLDAAQMSKALAVAKGIDSDFELRRALQDALSSQTLATSQQVQVLQLSREIGSDFEQAELLVTVVENQALEGEMLAAWRVAIAGIGSDFEKRRVIDALLGHGKPGPATVVAALDSAHSIGSDFETRQVLVAAAPHVAKDPAARAAYLRLAAGIASDFEMREALVALLEAGPVDVATADGVLQALRGMGSDFEVGEVLQKLARAMPADAGLIERYRAAARRLGDFERGQAEKALDRFASVD